MAVDRPTGTPAEHDHTARREGSAPHERPWARTKRTAASTSASLRDTAVRPSHERWLKVTATMPRAAASRPHEVYWPQSLAWRSRSGSPSPWTNTTTGHGPTPRGRYTSMRRLWSPEP